MHSDDRSYTAYQADHQGFVWLLEKVSPSGFTNGVYRRSEGFHYVLHVTVASDKTKPFQEVSVSETILSNLFQTIQGKEWNIDKAFDTLLASEPGPEYGGN